MEIITLHHEDWDFNRIFGDLAKRGIKQIEVRMPVEWQESEETKLAHTKNILRAAGRFGVEVVGLESDQGGTGISTKPEPTKTVAETPAATVPLAKLKKSPPPAQPSAVNTKGFLKNKQLWLVLGGILLGGLVVGGIVFSRRAVDQKEKPESLTSPETEITATPTLLPTPAPTLERSDLVVRVLNGSGKKGAAGTIKTVLDKLGYMVLEVGNASSYDYQDSELRLKSTTEIYRGLLTTDLKDYITIASGSVLPADETAGAELIVGKN